MAVKTITVTEDAYRRISSLKRPDESFSELFVRLTSNKASIWKYFGVLSSQEADEAQRTVREHRQRVTQSMEERYARIRHISDYRNRKK